MISGWQNCIGCTQKAVSGAIEGQVEPVSVRHFFETVIRLGSGSSVDWSIAHNMTVDLNVFNVYSPMMELLASFFCSDVI